MSVDAGLKHLKVIRRGEVGGWERVTISGVQRDKRVGVSAGSIFNDDLMARQLIIFSSLLKIRPSGGS